jgi:AcrR family transcriptional regulator
MKTYDLIKCKGLELFNEQGVLNVTLREIAKHLKKSYGNITYHFPTKQHLIEVLYQDLVGELQVLAQEIMQDKEHLFESIILAPKKSFLTAQRYVFFYIDYVEIRRNFPSIAEMIDAHNTLRMKGYLQTLVALQTMGYIRQDIQEQDLYYLMELSGAVRTFFFMKLRPEELKRPSLEQEYWEYTNRLLLPYLSSKGNEEYQRIMDRA